MLRLEILRNVNADHFAVVTELLSAAERADGQRALSDHLWLDLRQGGRTGFAAILGWEHDHDHPVAYSQVSRGNDSWSIDVVVHPHHRYDMAAIGPQMLNAAIETVCNEGGGHVHWWVFEPTSTHHTLASKVGLSPGRELIQMKRSLPLEQHLISRTTGFITRPFILGKDNEEWLAVNNLAFVEHAEQGGWDNATFLSRTNEPWFNPEGFLIHIRDNEMAGFCWTKLHPRESRPPVGEIYVIAVNPAHGGQGLGTLLTLAGLQALAHQGAIEAMLYVDRDNTGAVTMYERIGFTSNHRERAFVGDVH